MSKKIRVLQLASPSGLYGAEHWILALIRNLDPHRVQSLVATVKSAPEDTAAICNVSQKLGFPSFVLEAPGKFNGGAIKQLRGLLLQERVDIVHTHGYKTDVIGLLAARGIGCKIVSTPHGWTNNPDMKLRIYETLDKFVLICCDAVAPLSKGLFHSIEKLPFVSKKLTLIPNGVDLSEVAAPSKVPQEILRLKEDGRLIIGSISRLVPGKKIDLIIRALTEYSKLHWHLIVIGAGPEEAALKSLVVHLGVANRVDFLGFRQDRLAFLKGLDIFALASLSEGTPRCLMEAMAAKVPIVASDIEGCRNLIKNENTGLLFPAGDSRALAAGISRLAGDLSLREKIVKAAGAFVAEKFSAAVMAREYEALYASLVTSKNTLSLPHRQ